MEPVTTCPSCGGRVLPVLFGFPSAEAFEAVDRGELLLGGCEIERFTALRRCADCDAAFEYVDESGRPITGRDDIDPETERELERLGVATARDPRWVLLATITDELRRGASLVQWRGGQRGTDGSFVLAWPLYESTVNDTIRLLYDLSIVGPRDWVRWRRTQGDRAEDPRRIASADLDDTLHLLTSIVRGERFADGTIAAAIESGVLLLALDRLLELVDRAPS